MRRALFMDRDGTICTDKGYLDDPDGLDLLPGVEATIRRANEAGWQIVLITNQSGLARGLFDEDRLADIHDRLRNLLEKAGARVDGIYHCPHHVDGKVERYTGSCDCRKPTPGMLLRASDEMGIDLTASWTIGDRLKDVEAGHRAGTRAVMVRTGCGDEESGLIEKAAPLARPEYVASDLVEAVDWILRQETSA